MSDPQRLLDASDDGSPLARSLLEAGRDVKPPGAAQAEIWGNLEALLGPLGGPGGGGGSNGPSAAPSAQPAAPPPAGPVSVPAKAGALNLGSASSGTGAVTATKAGLGLSFGAKLGIGALVLGGLGAGAAVVSNRPSELAGPTAQTAQLVARDGDSASIGEGSIPRLDAKAAQATAAPEERRADASAAATSGPAPTDASPVDGPDESPTARKNMLLRESAGVNDARAAMRGGDYAKALSILGELDKEVKKGVMGQERVVLRIEALAKSGQAGAARAQAKAFLSKNAASPYADRVRPYAE